MRKSDWTKEEVDFLIENYSKLPKEEILKVIRRPWNKILNKKKLLKEQYPDKNFESYHIIQQLDHRADRLLEDTPEAFYWIGFLLADGHFDKSPKDPQNRIKLCLKDIDDDRVINLHKFLELKVKITYYSDRTTDYAEFSVVDKSKIRPICEKFDIKTRKTENPPDINLYKKFDPKLLLALIIGYIDGDGSIDIYGHCKIKVHKNWTLFLDFIVDILNKEFNMHNKPSKLIPQKNKRGEFNSYANLTIPKEVCKKLKQFIMDNNLDVMKRKWNRVKMRVAS